MHVQHAFTRLAAATLLGLATLGVAQAQAFYISNTGSPDSVFTFGADKPNEVEFGVSFMSSDPVPTTYTLDSWTYYAAGGQAGDVELVVTQWDVVNGTAVGSALFQQTYAYNGGNGPLVTFANMGVAIQSNVHYLVYATARGSNAATAPGVVEVKSALSHSGSMPAAGTWLAGPGQALVPYSVPGFSAPMYSSTFLQGAPVAAVPEPESVALVLSGLLTCVALQRRRRA